MFKPSQCSSRKPFSRFSRAGGLRRSQYLFMSNPGIREIFDDISLSVISFLESHDGVVSCLCACSNPFLLTSPCETEHSIDLCRFCRKARCGALWDCSLWTGAPAIPLTKRLQSIFAHFKWVALEVAYSSPRDRVSTGMFALEWIEPSFSNKTEWWRLWWGIRRVFGWRKWRRECLNSKGRARREHTLSQQQARAQNSQSSETNAQRFCCVWLGWFLEWACDTLLPRRPYGSTNMVSRYVVSSTFFPRVKIGRPHN